MSTDLIIIEALTPEKVFAPGGVEALIARVEAEVRATPLTMSTDEGRKAIKALAYKVARSKTALDDMGKELGAEHHKKWKAIAAERAVICDRLDALRDEVRGPLTAWEDAEKDRVDGHERALVSIIESTRFSSPPTAAELSARIGGISLYAGRDWQEFSERSVTAIGDALSQLHTMLDAAEQAERDAAELAELRRMKAEREAADQAAATAKAEADRKAREAEAQAERDRLRAEQAQRDQEAAVARATQQAEAAAAAEIARAQQAARDAEAASARAVEQERIRVAAQKAADDLAERKRQENKRHRENIHRKVARAIDQAFEGAEFSPERLIEAISAGIIPHLSIIY